MQPINCSFFLEMKWLGLLPSLRDYNVLLRGFLSLLIGCLLVETGEGGIDRNQETYMFLLNSYAHAERLEDTPGVIGEMKQRGFRLNSYVYSKITGLYRDNGMWKKAMSFVREKCGLGIAPDRRIYSGIIVMFGKYGQMDEAVKVFDNMQSEGMKPDIMTWNALVPGFCMAGDVRQALEFFNKMQEGLYTDPKIFTTNHQVA